MYQKVKNSEGRETAKKKKGGKKNRKKRRCSQRMS